MQVDPGYSTHCRSPENIPIDTALEIEQINLGWLYESPSIYWAIYFLRGAKAWTIN